MKKKTLILSSCGIICVVLCSLLYNHYSRDIPLDTWCKFSIPEKGKIGYSPEGLINDLPLPEVKKIDGQYKFLNRTNNYLFGYKIFVDVNHLDTTNIPDKYRHDEEVEINGKKITSLRTTEVTYQTTLRFIFLDKDGFELLKINTDTLFIESGKVNELQGLVEQPIPENIIKLTNKVQLFVSVEKCITCQ